jgi:hypothetical protein
MSPRTPPALVAPDEGGDGLVASQRRLAEALRRPDGLDGEHESLRRWIERLRPALHEAREKNARLTDRVDGRSEKLEGSRNSSSVHGTEV